VRGQEDIEENNIVGSVEDKRQPFHVLGKNIRHEGTCEWHKDSSFSPIPFPNSISLKARTHQKPFFIASGEAEIQDVFMCYFATM